MNSRRHVLTFITLSSIPAILIWFQNCAPVSPGAAAGSQPSQVHLIDDLNKTQLQFATPQVEVQDEVSQVDVDGLCNSSHTGAKLRWSIWADNDATMPLAVGAGGCMKGGQFDLALNQIDQLVCGVSHRLVVESDWGDTAVTHLIRHCQPLASQPIPAPADSPIGTSCFLEYQPATEAEQRCLQVCYRDSLMVFSQAAESTQCSSLASSLAGP